LCDGSSEGRSLCVTHAGGGGVGEEEEEEEEEEKGEGLEGGGEGKGTVRELKGVALIEGTAALGARGELSGAHAHAALACVRSESGFKVRGGWRPRQRQGTQVPTTRATPAPRC
jgi:hypothetical protein